MLTIIKKLVKMHPIDVNSSKQVKYTKNGCKWDMLKRRKDNYENEGVHRWKTKKFYLTQHEN